MCICELYVCGFISLVLGAVPLGCRIQWSENASCWRQTLVILTVAVHRYCVSAEKSKRSPPQLVNGTFVSVVFASHSDMLPPGVRQLRTHRSKKQGAYGRVPVIKPGKLAQLAHLDEVIPRPYDHGGRSQDAYCLTSIADQAWVELQAAIGNASCARSGYYFISCKLIKQSVDILLSP